MGRQKHLILWAEGLNIAKKIYNITTKERFLKGNHLRRHIRKAAISLNIEISEAFEKRNSSRKYIFLKKAIRLCEKVKDSLNCALYLGYINENEFKHLTGELRSVSVQLNGFFHKSLAFQEELGVGINHFDHIDGAQMNLRVGARQLG